MIRAISILGSTGSIGQSALEVVRARRQEFEVRYLAAGRNAERLAEQAREFRPRAVALGEASGVDRLRRELDGTGIELMDGAGVLELAGRRDVDVMLNALVGSAGMEPTIAAVEAGVTVALSNKESLVMAGAIINALCRKTGATILPVDSEHSALWQCLQGEKRERIRRAILTGSGGPFRTRSRETLSSVTVEEALCHPTWKMGAKITIDSATLMNKGLEVIEAHALFDLAPDQIEVMIHPQSVVHGMVEFVDGSVKAQLGLPDMRLPIQYALTYPDRRPAPRAPVDFAAIGSLTFERPDREKFPCLGLAYDALRRGGTAPAALNVANDLAVRLFLDGKIPFTKIAEINAAAVSAHVWQKEPDLAAIRSTQEWVEQFVQEEIGAEVQA